MGLPRGAANYLADFIDAPGQNVHSFFLSKVLSRDRLFCKTHSCSADPFSVLRRCFQQRRVFSDTQIKGGRENPSGRSFYFRESTSSGRSDAALLAAVGP